MIIPDSPVGSPEPSQEKRPREQVAFEISSDHEYDESVDVPDVPDDGQDGPNEVLQDEPKVDWDAQSVECSLTSRIKTNSSFRIMASADAQLCEHCTPDLWRESATSVSISPDKTAGDNGLLSQRDPPAFR